MTRLHTSRAIEQARLCNGAHCVSSLAPAAAAVSLLGIEIGSLASHLTGQTNQLPATELSICQLDTSVHFFFAFFSFAFLSTLLSSSALVAE